MPLYFLSFYCAYPRPLLTLPNSLNLFPGSILRGELPQDVDIFPFSILPRYSLGAPVMPRAHYSVAHSASTDSPPHGSSEHILCRTYYIACLSPEPPSHAFYCTFQPAMHIIARDRAPRYISVPVLGTSLRHITPGVYCGRHGSVTDMPDPILCCVFHARHIYAGAPGTCRQHRPPREETES